MAERTLEVPVWRFRAGSDPTGAMDLLAQEEPLTVRVRGRDLGVLMRTPGDDAALAAGFVLSEGVVAEPDHIADVRVCYAPQREEQRNVADVILDDAAPFHPERSLRTGLIASGCAVCGHAAIEEVMARRRPGRHPPRLEPHTLLRMAETLGRDQQVFQATGGLHAAGLFDAEGNLLAAAEDVGRHNAVDKVLGRIVLEGSWPPPPVLVTTSRGSFDLLLKAVMASIPVVAFMSAPSSLAVELGRTAGVSVVGFLRRGGFNVYVGAEGFGLEAGPP